MSAKMQLHWKSKEGDEWHFHSRVEESLGRDQIAAAKASSTCSFLYRLVANDSPDALAPVAESVYVGRMETIPPVFTGGRSAA